MLLTSVLILAYVGFGAACDFMTLLLKDDENRSLKYLVGAIVSLGGIANVLQYASNACSGHEESGNKLYFLTPISAMPGLIVAGYCSNHPDAIVATLMTGHLRIPPNSILKLILTDCPDPEILKAKLCTSTFIICSSFVGAIAGAHTKVWIVRSIYSQGMFFPTFTLFGCVMALLCILHCKFCIRFFEHRRSLDANIAKQNSMLYSSRRLFVCQMTCRNL